MLRKVLRRSFLLLLLVVLLIPSVSGAAEEFRTLRLGDSGEDVIALKTRMYELGYFTTTKFSSVYNETTRDRVKELQRKNGLKADGIVTPDLQYLIFSDECLPKSAKKATARPTGTPVPTATAAPAETAPEATAVPMAAGIPANTGTPASVPSPLQPPADAPALDEDGYLPEGTEPYIHADRSTGVWSYISTETHIEIREQSGKSEFGVNKWLEVHIRLKDPSRLISMVSGGKKPGNALVQPQTILAGHEDTILAFNDDFFGYRVRYKQKAGVIIRDGVILYDAPKKSTATTFPPLDIMAVFSDGSIKTFASDEHTAQEYLDMGVRDTYAFGPILVRNGQLSETAAKWGTNRAPRLGCGVTADGTIIVVDVLGRRKDARGVNVAWLADKMYELGCVEAMNLDGGNTTCLIFMGDMINRPAQTSSKNIRYITGLIGIEEEP